MSGDGARPLVATYRLQLSPDFRFADACERVPYFAALGVSHLYLSPITEARPGSTHGYDVVDHNQIRAELGGEEGFEALRERCVEAGLGLVLDFVPNHAGIGPTNEAWQDVLAYGPASPFADTFDLELLGADGRDGTKVLLPFLGRYYGDALDDGELSIVLEHGRLSAAYYDHRFALRPETYRAVIEHVLPRLATDLDLGAVGSLLREYQGLVPEDRARAEALRERFAEMARHVDLAAQLASLPTDKVHELLELQRWRLAYWKTAGSEINYRRFFDINDLAGLRMESPSVFAQSHALLSDLLRREGVDGVRIDHVDGLYDPRGYLTRLRELGARYVWVEKILAPRESLPEGWPVEGTTGYEVMNDLARVLVWPAAEGPLLRLWQRHGGVTEPWEEHVHEGKRLVMRTALSGELARLAAALVRMCRADYHTRDHAGLDLAEALAEVIAALGRYRTYLPDDREESEAAVRDAVARARHRNPATDPSVFELVARAILGPLRPDLEADRRLWVRRLQQYTAPVAAKGVEDTALYRDHRLVALNEVGGEPDRFALEPAAFHSRARRRAARNPWGLVCTATHDHKRGADVRMRLVLLAELHREWARVAARLEELGAKHASPVGPCRADAYLAHQTLVALWGSDAPESLRDRMSAYLLKAAREAKVRTSWIHPEEAYENALTRYLASLLEDEAVIAVVEPFAVMLARLAFVHSITQTVLQHTLPGVPDVYQGSELLDLSLVDPDNRRPVDFARRAALLDELGPCLEAPDVGVVRAWGDAQDERLKLYASVRLLRLRRSQPALLAAGEHRGLRGERHTLVFLRRGPRTADRASRQVIAVIVPRLLARRSPNAERTAIRGIPRGTYRDVLTDTRLEIAGELSLASLPLRWSVLVREG